MYIYRYTNIYLTCAIHLIYIATDTTHVGYKGLAIHSHLGMYPMLAMNVKVKYPFHSCTLHHRHYLYLPTFVRSQTYPRLKKETYLSPVEAREAFFILTYFLNCIFVSPSRMGGMWVDHATILTIWTCFKAFINCSPLQHTWAALTYCVFRFRMHHWYD